MVDAPPGSGRSLIVPGGTPLIASRSLVGPGRSLVGPGRSLVVPGRSLVVANRGTDGQRGAVRQGVGGAGRGLAG
jgi:hypothetical protein